MGNIVTLDNRAHVPPMMPVTGKSAVHRIALALVALTIGSGAVVMSEPAPIDALTLLLVVGLPIIGLVSIRPALVVFLSSMLVLAGCAFFASTLATDVAQAATHTAVSLYLYLAAFTFAAFVARNPVAHTRLILDAYQVAALLASVIGIVGYFDIVPGAGELFTKFGRATGPFKDPNVFGAFLVLAVIYELHQAVTKRGLSCLVNFAGLGLLMFAVLLSMSRGAWAATGLAVLIYGYLSFVTAKRNIERVKILGLATAGLLSAALIVTAALQVDAVSKLLEERAALTNSYDEGPDGRFGGHEKAQELILQHPIGIGALEFANRYHSEDVHNVYLSMFLNTGWLGGMMYLTIIGMSLIYGLRHAFKHTASQPLFIVAFSALVAMVLLGSLIDTDHWRHFYLLMGLVWGMMTGDRRIVRSPRIIADRRPLLLQPVIYIPPQRREARILRATTPSPTPLLPRRSPRIVSRRP